MSEELSKDEIAVAKKLQNESAEQNDQLNNIDSRITELLTIAKSGAGVEEEKKKAKDKEREHLDMDLTTEDMAKSIKNSSDPAKMIRELMEYANVGVSDVYDTEGDRVVDDELIKSLQEVDSKTLKVLGASIIAGDAHRDRVLKAFETNMNFCLRMAKSLQQVHEEIKELKDVTKSFARDDGDKSELPGTGDDVASSPISADTGNSVHMPRFTHDKMKKALISAFQDTPEKKFKYLDKLRHLEPDELYDSLHNSSIAAERDDSVALSAFLNQ